MPTSVENCSPSGPFHSAVIMRRTFEMSHMIYYTLSWSYRYNWNSCLQHVTKISNGRQNENFRQNVCMFGYFLSRVLWVWTRITSLSWNYRLEYHMWYPKCPWHDNSWNFEQSSTKWAIIDKMLVWFAFFCHVTCSYRAGVYHYHQITVRGIICDI